MFIKLAQSLFAAALLAAVLTFSASAGNENGQNGSGPGQNGNAGRTVGAPGPVAGIGFTAVAVVGGYVWFMRRRRQGKAK
jgi:hypothetical protein